MLQELVKYSDRLRAGLRLPAGTASVLVSLEEARNDEWASRQALPDELKNAVPKRQDEFRAGRLAAARALHGAGFPSFAWLGVASDRTPCWPAGWAGSISHSGTHALATTVPVWLLRGVGVDIQHVVSPHQLETIRKTVADEWEWLLLHRIDALIALTLLFSAKESLYKALFPCVGCFFDFSAATLIGVDDGILRLRLSCDWSEHFRTGQIFEANFLLAPPFVMTSVQWEPAVQ